MRHAFVGLMLVLAAMRVDAQTGVHEMRVRVQAENTPIAGALVAVVNARSEVVIERLTRESGAVVFQIPGGTYRLRVRRVGFYPHLSDTIQVARDRDVTLRVENRAVVLRDVVVTARSSCPRARGGDAELALVLGEVYKALRASELTQTDLRTFPAVRVFRVLRRYDLQTADDTLVNEVRSGRRFAAIDPRDLARQGYVRGNFRDGWRYFAPDEKVLLSEEFADTHCFRLVRDTARAGQVGVAFEPVPRRRVSDIAGTMWLDEQSAELREIVFRFVGSGLLERFGGDGFTRFVRAPSGAWLVSEWKLRAPLIASAFSLVNPYRVIGHAEDGGMLISSEATIASPVTGDSLP